jgi:hypothetical protein
MGRCMVLGMATTKVTITLDQEQVESIRALVAAGQSPNVSAFVKHAVRNATLGCGGVERVAE